MRYLYREKIKKNLNSQIEFGSKSSTPVKWMKLGWLMELSVLQKQSNNYKDDAMLI